MGFNWILLQILITAYSVAIPDPRYQLAAHMPQELIYINASTVQDLNGDGVPEVYLSAGGSWWYYVYYYMDGRVGSVEDLLPWTYTSDLCYTADGRLVLYAFPHTVGSADNLQYRVYEWTSTGGHLTENLWHRPAAEREENKEPDGLEYISSPEAIDPFVMEEYSDLLITQKEFNQKVADLDEIYGQIQKQILNWQ